MSLVSIVKNLQGRDLTEDEVKTLNNFQIEYKIDDDDPLIVVLAIMARSQLIIDTLPKRLEESAKNTIESHRMAMREQAVLIAKDLVSELSEKIYLAIDTKNKAIDTKNKRWSQFAEFFLAGFLIASSIAAVVFFIFK